MGYVAERACLQKEEKGTECGEAETKGQRKDTSGGSFRYGPAVFMQL